MPLESGSYISDLTPTNPSLTDNAGDSAAHLRLIKATLKQTFPSVTGAITATHTSLNAAAGAFSVPGQITIPNGDGSGVIFKETANSAGLALFAGGNRLAAWDPSGNMAVAGALSGGGSISAAGGGTLGGSLSVNGDVNITGAFRRSGVDIAPSLVPPGAIILWYGQTTNIPYGWVLCDGNNTTPDLRDRFVVGAGKSYTAGSGGGAASYQTSSAGAHAHGYYTASGGDFSASGQTDAQGSHSHAGATGSTALTVDQIPSHSHTFNVASTNTGPSSGIASTATTGTQPAGVASTGGGNGHNHSITSDGTHQHNWTVSVGGHAHGITLDGAHTHSVSTLPPYYALCYIMKT